MPIRNKSINIFFTLVFSPILVNASGFHDTHFEPPIIQPPININYHITNETSDTIELYEVAPRTYSKYIIGREGLPSLYVNDELPIINPTETKSFSAIMFYTLLRPKFHPTPFPLPLDPPKRTVPHIQLKLKNRTTNRECLIDTGGIKVNGDNIYNTFNFDFDLSDYFYYNYKSDTMDNNYDQVIFSGAMVADLVKVNKDVNLVIKKRCGGEIKALSLYNFTSNSFLNLHTNDNKYFVDNNVFNKGKNLESYTSDNIEFTDSSSIPDSLIFDFQLDKNEAPYKVYYKNDGNGSSYCQVIPMLKIKCSVTHSTAGIALEFNEEEEKPLPIGQYEHECKNIERIEFKGKEIIRATCPVQAIRGCTPAFERSSCFADKKPEELMLHYDELCKSNSTISLKNDVLTCDSMNTSIPSGTYLNSCSVTEYSDDIGVLAASCNTGKYPFINTYNPLYMPVRLDYKKRCLPNSKVSYINGELVCD